jgi:hypothetical protein
VTYVGTQPALDVDADLAARGFLRQIADVAETARLEPAAEVLLDRLRLGGRFDNDEVASALGAGARRGGRLGRRLRLGGACRLFSSGAARVSPSSARRDPLLRRVAGVLSSAVFRGATDSSLGSVVFGVRATPVYQTPSGLAVAVFTPKGLHSRGSRLFPELPMLCCVRDTLQSLSSFNSATHP